MTSSAGRTAPAPGDPWGPVISELVPALAERLRAAGASVEPEWIADQLEIADGPEGDLSLAVHRPAGVARVPPAVLAQRVADGFPKIVGVESVHAVGGYVNVRADSPWLADATLREVRTKGTRYGRSEPGGPTVCVEHTSANPTGPLHVGRIRNGIIGDTFARVLRASGHAVTTQFYVDDVGRQAAMVSWIWSKPIGEWPEEIRASLGETPADDPSEPADRRYGRPYPSVSAYLKGHPDAAGEVGRVTESLEAGEELPQHRQIVEAILGGMTDSLARIGIRFDEFVWESGFLRDGSVLKVLARLGAAPHAAREPNGALAIDATGKGLPKESTRIVVARANGTSLYVTRDIAYHLAKFARFPRVIDVLGQDHLLHARTLDVLLGEIGEVRRPEFVHYQFLTAPEGGGMSTRKGTAVHLDALLDEAVELARAEVVARWPDAPPEEVERIASAVAAGAVRYHIVRVAADKSVGFRWEDALSFEGRSGPFVQYAFVRATSLLRKAGEGPFDFDGRALTEPTERSLIREIAQWPRVVGYAARTAHVHALASYAHDLAESFNRFYQAVPVLKAEGPRSSRLALVEAARTTLGSVLDLLGVPTLERM